MSETQNIANACLAALLIVCYTVLTALGQDGNTLLVLLGGQGLGFVTTHGAKIAENGSG